MKSLTFFCLLVFAQFCSATTWFESKVDDPIRKGKKCKVSEPGSYGGYIYQWPSKYDQVFWPYTDGHGIWFCKKSGFVSFMPDFGEVSDNEVALIKKYLKKNKLKKPTKRQLVEALEELNELREFTPEYRNMLTRVYARWYQEFGELEEASKYRKKAYEDIKIFLKSEISQDKKLEYLYLAANYSRYFNELKESEMYIEQLKSEISRIDDPELSGYGEYLSELLINTKYIVPGGKFEPTLPKEGT